MIDKMAGKIVPKDRLEDIPSLISAYFMLTPDPMKKDEMVSFGTSGHRGNAYKKSFNENHVKAISQAICEYRKENGINGILFIGKDTHALSTPAQMSALEVFIANGVKIAIAKDNAYTATPLISFAIIEENKKKNEISDGIVITPSHNPPSDGGYKYNPPDGGPAGRDVTSWIEKKANEILKNNLKNVQTIPYEEAKKSNLIVRYDFITPYVQSLKNIIDIDAIKKANLKIGANPLGILIL